VKRFSYMNYIYKLYQNYYHITQHSCQNINWEWLVLPRLILEWYFILRSISSLTSFTSTNWPYSSTFSMTSTYDEETKLLWSNPWLKSVFWELFGISGKIFLELRHFSRGGFNWLDESEDIDLYVLMDSLLRIIPLSWHELCDNLFKLPSDINWEVGEM